MTVSSFVPVQSASTVRPEINFPDWASYLKGLISYINTEDYGEEVARHRKWETNIRFYRGHQVGVVRAADGLWQDVPVPQNSNIRVNNILRYFVDNIVKEVVRSQATLQVAAKEDSVESQGVARLTKSILEDIQKKTWTPGKRQAESKYVLLCGNSFRYNTYTYENSSEFCSYPRISHRVVREASEHTVCTLCGSEAGGADSPPSDPSCQHQFEQLSIPEIAVPYFDGEDKYPVGDISSEVVDPMEIKLHLHSRSLEESPYLRRSRLVLKDYLQGLYPWANISQGTAETTPLSTQAELERLTGSGTMGTIANSGQYERQSRLDEYWLEPVLYGAYVFQTDTEMADGQVIPAGTSALELFPDGLYVAASEGIILEVKNNAKNAHWVHVIWNKIPGCIYGDGIDDAIEKQKQHNDAATLVHDNLMSNTAPPMFYNPVKVNRGQISAKPGHAVPLKNATPSDNPANYVYQMQTRSLGAEVHQVLTEQKQDMALMVGGAFSSLGSVDGASAPDTATGLAIVRDAALSHLAPFLELKSEADIRMAHQWLHLIKEYQVGERSLAVTSDYSEVEKRKFASTDVDTDLFITVRPGSVSPRTDLERRNDVIEAMAVGGVPMGIFNPMMPQRLRRLLAERFNIPFDADETAADERKQQIEIDQMWEIFKVAQELGLGYPEYRMMVAEKIMVDVMVDNHDIQMQYIVRYLKKDKGLNAPDEIKMILHEHLNEHLQAKMMMMQMAAGMGAGVAVPQNQEEAAQGSTPQAEGKTENGVQQRQAAAGAGNQGYDQRPTGPGEMKSGAKRVTPVTQKPHQSQAAQPN